MPSPAIELLNVSKCFRLHHERPRSFQEVVVGLFRQNKSRAQEFWPLRQVSFAVEPGETFGLIGPNGAGKSTVLKVIARIIEPTSGQVQVNGRVTGMLELGTGFHPDLSGRENIYLNGSVLGLSRREIAQRVDSIIEFAELARFIDMPVRNYSSGMLMRLGFAVATSLEPDILLIDEVLAVGDQAFQARCLERIGQMRARGITILFVSHGLDIVSRLCQRAAWLDEGRVQAIGPADQVVVDYLGSVWKRANIQLQATGDASGRGRRWGSGEAVITRVEFMDREGRLRRIFSTGEPFVARIYYRASQPIHRPAFGVAFYRADGAHINGPNTAQSGFDIEKIEGEGAVDYVIDALPLLTGRYEFTAAIYDYHSVHPYDHQHRAFAFEVQADTQFDKEGLVHIPCRWEHHHD